MKARRPWAWPLVPLYAASLAAKDVLRAVGVLPTRRLGWPVVSVGSLSAGGAGKTPVVIALAGLMGERGWQVNVLSRGYGREGNGVERVDPEREDAALRFGDEPVEIARSADVAVWVGADRFDAGQAAEAEPGVRGRGLHLLDDGFQHRRLARAVDIVLVTAEDLDDALLPAGNRREPLRALRRADVVAVRAEEMERVRPAVRRWLRPDAPVWGVERRLRLPGTFSAGEKLLGFCGIARPESFWRMLREAGCEVAGKLAFGDHHRYESADMERLVTRARESGATGFVTTEKDAVKLSGAMRARLESVGPISVARLDVVFSEPEQVIADVEARLR